MKYKKIITLFLSIMLLSSCGTTNTNNTIEKNNSNISTNENTESSNIYPITITHAFGETIITEKPVNIATIGWGNQDVPLALGIVPVGMPISNYGVVDENGLALWTSEALNNLNGSPITYDETDGIDFESVNATNPDVILAAYSGITKEDYELLSSIAPVVAYPEVAWQTYWRDQILLNSRGMGLIEEGENLVNELDRLISEKLKNYPEIEGKSAVFIYLNPADLGSFYIYIPKDPRANYLLDLGFIFPESIYELSDDANNFFISVSAEHVDILNDVDVIVGYGNDNFLEDLQNDSLIGTIPAIKRGSVILLEDNTVVAASATPSALSIPYTIDEYLELFSKAISNIE